MRSRNSPNLLSSPTLVGSITVLVLTIGVFLAYNANNGLPFVPTRQVKIQFDSGSELLKGNEVRQGGYRVGIVSAMKPVRLANGRIGAQATLNLDKQVGPLPVDSVATIRTRSALGLKYLELTRGTSQNTIADGGLLPSAQTIQEVDLDQVYGIFDKRTRDAAQVNLQAFGDAFTGRGAALSDTITSLPRTLNLLLPVAQNLSNPATDLGGLFPALERVANTVAPLSSTAAKTFTSMADTFAAISKDPQALKDTIAKGPDTLAVSTTSLRAQQPFLRDAARFAGYLNVAASNLRSALPSLNSALAVATPVTLRSPELYNNLQPALGALRDPAVAPTTNAALRGLTATVGTLQPQLRYLGPFITVCNYWNTFWDFVSEHLSSPSPQGTSQRALINFATQQTNGYGMAGSANQANGQGVPPGMNPTFFHGAPYNHAIDTQGRADCVNGQLGQIHRNNKYGDPTANIDVDPHQSDTVGYPEGPTYAHYSGGHGIGLNPSTVPPGETFTPQAGGLAPKLP
ncbi:MAG: MlaD family protein [Solirubrobacteraceae bacterium]